MTKQQEFNQAQKIINKWCKLNKIQQPIITREDLHCLGIFRSSIPNTITINITKCKLSSKGINSNNVFDKSITGTLFHELGHYIHINWNKDLTKSFKKLKEPTIHYFETDIHEDIAESIRLFISNPSLLMEGRPKRYKILQSKFKNHKRPHFTQLLQNQPLEKRKMIYSWLSQYI